MCLHLIDEVPRAFRTRLEDPIRVLGHVGLSMLARSAVPHHTSEVLVGLSRFFGGKSHLNSLSSRS